MKKLDRFTTVILVILATLSLILVSHNEAYAAESSDFTSRQVTAALGDWGEVDTPNQNEDPDVSDDRSSRNSQPNIYFNEDLPEDDKTSSEVTTPIGGGDSWEDVDSTDRDRGRYSGHDYGDGYGSSDSSIGPLFNEDLPEDDKTPSEVTTPIGGGDSWEDVDSTDRDRGRYSGHDYGDGYGSSDSSIGPLFKEEGYGSAEDRALDQAFLSLKRSGEWGFIKNYKEEMIVGVTLGASLVAGARALASGFFALIVSGQVHAGTHSDIIMDNPEVLMTEYSDANALYIFRSVPEVREIYKESILALADDSCESPLKEIEEFCGYYYRYGMLSEKTFK